MDTALQDNALLTLIDLRQITSRFANTLEMAITSTAGSTSGIHVEDLVAAIHAPYVPYLLQYGKLEEEYLLQELETIQMEKRNLIDCTQLLSDSVNKLFRLGNEAVERCVLLTDACGCAALLVALKTLFSSYCKKFDGALNTLHTTCGLDSMAPPDGELGEDWSKFQHALKIIQTCGELLLQGEEFELQLSSSLLNRATNHLVEVFSPTSITNITSSHTSNNPFQEYNYLVKEDPVQHGEFIDIINQLKQDGEVPLLQDVMSSMSKVNEHAHKFAFTIVFYHLARQLAQISNMEVWVTEGGMLSADLPTFSLSPLEYITKIGQYVMTLPQQLEPFTTQENPALEKALQAGRLPFPPQEGATEESEHLADHWLGAVARGTMHTYTEAILRIREMTPHAARQLATDIDYLCNVFDALEINASQSLKDIETLLKLPLSQYGETKGKIPDRLVHAVGNMRSAKEK